MTTPIEQALEARLGQTIEEMIDETAARLENIEEARLIEIVNGYMEQAS